MTTTPNIERHPLQPFLPKDARLLMLGSFPPPRTIRSSMSAPQTRAPHLPLTQCTAFREMRLYRFWSIDFFYPNPQNDMWRIMGQVFFGDKEHFVERGEKNQGCKAVFKYDEIVAFCEKRGIAIFDTAQAVIRQKGNASDEHLEIVEQTDIAALLQQLPQCHDICCTGGKAAETLAEMLHTGTPNVGEYIKTTFADRLIRFWRMPSTSRAYPLSLDKKAVAYQNMFAEVGTN